MSDSLPYNTSPNPTEYIVNSFSRLPDDTVSRLIERLDNPESILPQRDIALCEDVTYRAVRMYGEPGFYDEGELMYLRGMGHGAVLASMTFSPQKLRMADAPLHTRLTRDERFGMLMVNVGILYIDHDSVQRVVTACVDEIDPLPRHRFLATHGMVAGLRMAELGRFQRMQQVAGDSVLRNTRKIINQAYVAIQNEIVRGNGELQKYIDEEYEILATELEPTSYGPYTDSGL